MSKILIATNSIEEQLLQLLPSESEVSDYFDNLWPICRSITGKGFDETVKILEQKIPLKIDHFESGTKVYDWIIPRVWNIKDAWVKNSKGVKVVDFKVNNLHVISYSQPIHKKLSLSELKPFLYSLPQQPNAIPYLTTYYKEAWGFCVTHKVLENLENDTYEVYIDSELSSGTLKTATALLPATDGSDKEIFLSTYLCHPSLANNELSGPIVASYLYSLLSKIEHRPFNIRFAFVPETIGAIAYLSLYGAHLKKFCDFGFVITCCGDEKRLTFKNTRSPHYINELVLHILNKTGVDFKNLDFFPTGSDERQYSSPAFDLKMASLMRSMYGDYPEYHTSLDNKEFISMNGIRESLYLYLKIILSAIYNERYVNQMPFGEPQLGLRGLYPQTGAAKNTKFVVEKMMWVLNYSDSNHSLHDIALKSNFSILDLAEEAQKLEKSGLLKLL